MSEKDKETKPSQPQNKPQIPGDRREKGETANIEKK